MEAADKKRVWQNATEQEKTMVSEEEFEVMTLLYDDEMSFQEVFDITAVPLDEILSITNRVSISLAEDGRVTCGSIGLYR